MRRRSVAIVQRVVPPYRLRLFHLMREMLADENVELKLIAGTGDQLRGGANTPPEWADLRPSKRIGPGSKKLEFQSVLGEGLHRDLVVLEQASKDIHTGLMLALPFRARIGLWGHGRNMQTSTISPTGEAVKRRLLERADWFWAYTPATARELIDAGFPSQRLTTLTNTIDGTALRDRIDSITDAERNTLRAKYGLASGPVVLFLSRLYDLKRPSFAIESALEMRRRHPDLSMVVIGDGPLRPVISDAAAQHPWIVDLGELHGVDIAPWLDIADVMLQPGMVGLAAVDALASALPVASIEDQQHSPEFSYLVDGWNSIILPKQSSPAAFGAAVADLLSDEARLEHLTELTRADRDRFRIETMATDFVTGILAALDAPRR